MAETYGVLDWRQLPLVTAATLAQGLPASSRVARHFSHSVDDVTLMLAIIADRIGHVAWMFSADGQNGKNHPESLFDRLIGGGEKEKTGFATPEAFDAWWADITGTGGEGNA